MTHDVFISYASDDKPIADAVCAALEHRQIHCWIAPRDARPGLDYADSIIDALDETSVVVFIVSSRSIVSPHVKREVEHAASSGTHIIPFRVENVELSRGLRFFLGTVHWIDALTTPIDKHLDYLVEAVQYFLDRKRAAETSGQVLPAAPGEPIPGSVPPSVPPRDDAAAQAAMELSPIGGAPPPTTPPATAAPAPQATILAPERASASPAAPAAKPAEPPPDAPVRPILPGATTVPGPRLSEVIAQIRQRISDARSLAAERVARPADQALQVSRHKVGDFGDLWRVVGVAAIGAAVGHVLGYSIALSSGDDLPYSGHWSDDHFLSSGRTPWQPLGPSFATILAAGIVTWCWLYSVRYRRWSPAGLGGLGGCLGGAVSLIAIAIAPPRGPSVGDPLFVVGYVLQWIAFGIVGGLALGHGRSTRPGVALGVALVCVSFLRWLIYRTAIDGEWYSHWPYAQFDLGTAIGWGTALIVYPAAITALRQPQPDSNAAAAPVATAEHRPALGPQTKNPLWQVIGFATVGAALGELLAYSILRAIFGTEAQTFMMFWLLISRSLFRFSFMTIMIIVPAAIVTWAWSSAVRQGTMSPATMGGLGGMLGGWLSMEVIFHPASFIVIAQTLQWAVFGVAGGLAAGRGRSARPGVSMSIALVCVFFVRTLYLGLYADGRDNPFALLLFDLLTAIGWGVGLIVCPATTAAFRQPQAPGDTSAIDRATPPG